MKKTYHKLGAAITMGALMASSDQAEAANNFTAISNNIQTSISGIPALLAGLAYLMGILLAVLGVIKIKDHVENPSNTPLKDGAIRLAAGGMLFVVPFLADAMSTTIDAGVAGTDVRTNVNKVNFGVVT